MKTNLPFYTANGSWITARDGPVKICPGCGKWIRETMEPCGSPKTPRQSHSK